MPVGNLAMVPPSPSYSSPAPTFICSTRNFTGFDVIRESTRTLFDERLYYLDPVMRQEIGDPDKAATPLVDGHNLHRCGMVLEHIAQHAVDNTSALLVYRD